MDQGVTHGAHGASIQQAPDPVNRAFLTIYVCDGLQMVQMVRLPQTRFVIRGSGVQIPQPAPIQSMTYVELRGASQDFVNR